MRKTRGPLKPVGKRYPSGNLANSSPRQSGSTFHSFRFAITSLTLVVSGILVENITAWTKLLKIFDGPWSLYHSLFWRRRVFTLMWGTHMSITVQTLDHRPLSSRRGHFHITQNFCCFWDFAGGKYQGCRRRETLHTRRAWRWDVLRASLTSEQLPLWRFNFTFTNLNVWPYPLSQRRKVWRRKQGSRTLFGTSWYFLQNKCRLDYDQGKAALGPALVISSRLV